MADRTRSITRSKERKTDAGGRRRVTKSDGRLADYSSLKTSTGIVVPEVRKVMIDRNREETKERNSRAHSKIYPSEMSRSDWCHRATWYRMMGYPEPESKSSFTLENVFAQGNTIHNKWQSWLSQTGKLWGDWRCNRCAEYVKDSLKPAPDFSGSCVGTTLVDLTPPGGPYMGDIINYTHDWQYKEVTLRSMSLPISGHADGALIEHDCLIELKSLGIGSLRYEAPKLLEQNTNESKTGKKIIDIDGVWKDFHRPLTAHLKQGNIYLWMAQEMGMPFDKISFVYEFKANQQVKEFVVPYSMDIISEMLSDAQDIVRQLEIGIPPDCPFNGCSQCRSYEKEMEKQNGKK